MKRTIHRHALVTYFLATFVLSWGVFLAVVGPLVGIPAPAEAFSTTGSAFAAGIFAILCGPPIASLVLTGVLAGRPGLRELRRRALRARIPARYYAMTLIAPGALLTVLAFLSVFDRGYLPGFLSASAPAVAAAIVYALAAGFFEELGWTGFATPRLIARFGSVRGGLLLGVIWTAWHILPVFTFSYATQGALYAASLVQSLIFLASFRVVMTIVYERTGSLLMSMLLHASLTAASILGPPVTSPDGGLIWNTVWPLSLTAVAAVLAASTSVAPSPFRADILGRTPRTP